jgi:hypothetical protein
MTQQGVFSSARRRSISSPTGGVCNVVARSINWQTHRNYKGASRAHRSVAGIPVFGLDALSSAAYGPLLAGIAIWMDGSVQKIVIEGPDLKAKILVSDLLLYAFFIGRVLKSRIVYRPGLKTNSIDRTCAPSVYRLPFSFLSLAICDAP